MEIRTTRFERKREQALRSYVVTNGDQNPARYTVNKGMSLQEAVSEIVSNYEFMARGHVDCRDLAIWRAGKLIAVSHRRQGKDTVTFFADEEV